MNMFRRTLWIFVSNLNHFSFSYFLHWIALYFCQHSILILTSVTIIFITVDTAESTVVKAKGHKLFISFLVLGYRQEVVERLIRLVSEYNLTIHFQLHCLTTVNYIPWFSLLRYLPWLLSLNNGSEYGTHCCTSMVSVTRELCSYDGCQTTVHCLTLTGVSFAYISEVWTSGILVWLKLRDQK
jgi:hypothetical protein